MVHKTSLTSSVSANINCLVNCPNFSGNYHNGRVQPQKFSGTEPNTSQLRRYLHPRPIRVGGIFQTTGTLHNVLHYGWSVVAENVVAFEKRGGSSTNHQEVLKPPVQVSFNIEKHLLRMARPPNQGLSTRSCTNLPVFFWFCSESTLHSPSPIIIANKYDSFYFNCEYTRFYFPKRRVIQHSLFQSRLRQSAKVHYLRKNA